MLLIFSTIRSFFQLKKLGSYLEMSLDGRFQPQSKYNLEIFPKCDPFLIYQTSRGRSGEKKTRCYTKTKYARRLESRFQSLLTRVVILLNDSSFALRYAFRFA